MSPALLECGGFLSLPLMANLKPDLRKYIIAALILFGGFNGLWAQSLSLISASSCGSVLESPLYADQLMGAASISLKINYDTTKLQFDGVRSMHPAIGSALNTANQGQFIVAWFSLNPVSLPADTMLVIKWIALQPAVCTLSFDVQTPGNVEVTNLQGQPLSLQFNNATVERMAVSGPVVQTALQLNYTNETEVSIFYSAGSCLDSYVFQQARDSAFSVQLQTVGGIIRPHRFVFPNMQPNQGDSLLWWRVGGVSGADTLWTTPGRIAFEPSTSLNNHGDWLPWKAYPNPFSEFICLESAEGLNGQRVQLELYNFYGQRVMESELLLEGNRLCWRPETSVPVGNYLLFWKISDKKGRVFLIKSPS